jgi:hypothetical protein
MSIAVDYRYTTAHHIAKTGGRFCPRRARYGRLTDLTFRPNEDFNRIGSSIETNHGLIPEEIKRPDRSTLLDLPAEENLAVVKLSDIARFVQNRGSSVVGLTRSKPLDYGRIAK